MGNYENLFLVDAKEEISFNQYKKRLEDIFLTTRREQYFDEIFTPLLRMCCPKGVNVIPVFDDRNVGPQTDEEGENKKRIEKISASYLDENGKTKYAIPDYNFVDSSYTFDMPSEPYVMVETKIPQLIYEKNRGWFYLDLMNRVKENKTELEEEIKKCGCVIFTDGITWAFLELNSAQEGSEMLFKEKLEPIRLVNVKENRYYKRKNCNYFNFFWKNDIEKLDEDFFKEIGLDISGDIETPPTEWYDLIKRIKDLVQEKKVEKEQEKTTVV